MKNRRSIYHTPVARTIINQNQLRELVKFLAVNRQTIQIPAEESRRILSTRSRSISQTPISQLFVQASDLGKDRVVSLLDIPTSIANTPEVITYQHVTFDTKQFKEISPSLTQALETTPFHDKIVVNATPWLTRTGGISDFLALQSSMVRDFLSRSYYMTDRTWISPSVTRHLCKVYSMSLATTVATIYNLTYPEQQSVAAVFAYYFLTQTVPANDVEDMLKSSASYLGIDKTSDVPMITDMIKEEKVDIAGMTLEDACTLITKLGINRMSTLKARLIQDRVRSWGPDVHTSIMALEYPPYLAYLILLSGSGVKIGLRFALKRIGADREMRTLTDTLMKAPGFLGAI